MSANERQSDARDMARELMSRAATHQAQDEQMRQAVGLAMTIAGNVTLDGDDPVGSIQRVIAAVEQERRVDAMEREAAHATIRETTLEMRNLKRDLAVARVEIEQGRMREVHLRERAEAVERDRGRLATELATALRYEDEAITELRWCSGSADFAPGGRARDGWVTGPQLVIDAYDRRNSPRREGGVLRAEQANTAAPARTDEAVLRPATPELRHAEIVARKLRRLGACHEAVSWVGACTSDWQTIWMNAKLDWRNWLVSRLHETASVRELHQQRERLIGRDDATPGLLRNLYNGVSAAVILEGIDEALAHEVPTR